jgi:hypothetical protein
VKAREELEGHLAREDAHRNGTDELRDVVNRERIQTQKGTDAPVAGKPNVLIAKVEENEFYLNATDRGKTKIGGNETQIQRQCIAVL